MSMSSTGFLLANRAQGCSDDHVFYIMSESEKPTPASRLLNAPTLRIHVRSKTPLPRAIARAPAPATSEPAPYGAACIDVFIPAMEDDRETQEVVAERAAQKSLARQLEG